MAHPRVCGDHARGQNAPSGAEPWLGLLLLRTNRSTDEQPAGKQSPSCPAATVCRERSCRMEAVSFVRLSYHISRYDTESIALAGSGVNR
jgi:hypothetical protein